ncbi:MAG: TrbG/VirB9 family P-type conjugative transfer protein [Pseudobdellovibrionaceae bacterium]
MKKCFFIHLTALFFAQFSFANVKTVTLKADEILNIKTALGIATIIQIPDTIQSAIVGDQSAYRIEYIDKAVTVKPLRYGAKTNLYLFTQKRRYNLRLETVPQNQAYYIIYVQDKGTGETPAWQSVDKFVIGKSSTIKLLRIANTSDGFLLLDLEIIPKINMKVQPSDFWIRQSTISKPIHSLFLSKVNFQKGQMAHIGMSIQKSDLANKDLNIDWEGADENLRIILPKEMLWK